MILYSYLHSSSSRRVKLALLEKGLEYREVSISLEEGEQKTRAFLDLNPFGKVPVLEDGGFVLHESGAILEYLEEKYPDKPLLPQDIEARAQCRLWERLHENYLQSHLKVLLQQYYFTKPAQRNEILLAQTFKDIQKFLKWANTELSLPYFSGNFFGFADLFFVPTILNALPNYNLDLSAHKNLMAWKARVAERPSVSRTDPGPFRIPQPKKKIA